MAKKDIANPGAERGAVEVADGPLLDLTDAAVKRMIKLAKKRGFVTYAELNAVLPSEEVNSEQIEDILAMLSEMGINVIENEEHDDASPEESAEEEEAEGGDLIEAVQAKQVTTRSSEPADRTDYQQPKINVTSFIHCPIFRVNSIRGTGQKVFFGTDNGEGRLAQPVPSFSDKQLCSQSSIAS